MRDLSVFTDESLRMQIEGCAERIRVYLERGAWGSIAVDARFASDLDGELRYRKEKRYRGIA